MFFLDDTKKIAEYSRQYCKNETAAVLRVADDAVNLRFRFETQRDMEQRGDYVEFKNEIDWLYQPAGDNEWVYSFNRMRYWICLGQAYAITQDEKYTKAFIEQVAHWIKNVSRSNPDCNKAWRTIEIGFRLEYWMKAFDYFKSSSHITDEVTALFYSSVTEHAEVLMNHYPPYSLISNWGVIENHGLFIAGVMLPRSERSAQYIKTAISRMTEQLQVQIYRDGFQWEQSPSYHNEILQCYFDVKILADRNSIELSDFFNERLLKMSWASVYMSKPDRTELMTGDSDEVDIRGIITKSAYLFENSGLKYFGYNRLDFNSLWDLGYQATCFYDEMKSEKPHYNDTNLTPLTHSGNYCIHNGFTDDETFLHFICGTMGSGHGHNDCLHIDIFANGEDMLVDAGRYTYADIPERYEFKNSSAHNVIMVDGRDYIEWLDSWRSDKLGNAVNHKMHNDEKYAFIEGGNLVMS